MATPRFSNGSEHLDWCEVWCFRCRHDHDLSHPAGPETGPGCDIALRMVSDEDTPELEDAGYVIHFHDDDGDEHTHEIPNVSNSLPAATFCTSWEPCEVECRRHVNGAIIDRIERTTS